MKVKLDDYEIDILINGLFQQRYDYDQKTISEIDNLLLLLIRVSENMKLCRRRKLRFETCEV